MRWQYPLSGKRMICLESWFQLVVRELDMISFTSGKTSSITSRWALTLILSPKSGATCITTHSHSRHTLPHSRLFLQCSSSACSGANLKKLASSYSREYSCKHRQKQKSYILKQGLRHIHIDRRNKGKKECLMKLQTSENLRMNTQNTVM